MFKYVLKKHNFIDFFSFLNDKGKNLKIFLKL